MNVRLLADHEVAMFAAAAGPFLRSEPFTANVVAVEVDGVAGGRRPLRQGSLWILVEAGGRTIGAAMQTPPDNLFLPRLRAGIPEAVATAVWPVRPALPGVSGEAETVARFCRAWEELGGPRSVRRLGMRMYVLGELRPPVGVAGGGRPAGVTDVEVVLAWVRAFVAEARQGGGQPDVDGTVRRRLAGGELWLWEAPESGGPVSLAGLSPRAAGVARVGPVYTPPDRRGHGYGSAVTALASQAGRQSGAAHVVLYTDRSNPTSNAVYRAIGFVADHDAEERAFVSDAPGRR